jgi:hypothetical protein
MRRLVATCMVAGLLATTGAAPALASRPVTEHFSGSFSEVDSDTCGFPILVSLSFSSRVTFFYDAAGNLDRSIAHISLRGTDSAHGVSLIESEHFTHTFDFSTGLNRDLGLTAHVRVPGGGTVLVEAGQVVSDDFGNIYFVAGNHQPLEGDFASYCAAFD